MREYFIEKVLFIIGYAKSSLQKFVLQIFLPNRLVEADKDQIKTLFGK